MVRFVPSNELSIIIKILDEAHLKLKKASIRKKETHKRMVKIKARNSTRFKKMKKERFIDGEKLQLLYKNTQKAVDEFNEAYEALFVASENYESIKLSLITVAGVPEKYHRNFVIERTNRGTVNIYFGGKNGPFGDNHGHYVINDYGIMTYRREYGEEHGVQHHYPEGCLVYADCNSVMWPSNTKASPCAGLFNALDLDS